MMSSINSIEFNDVRREITESVTLSLVEAAALFVAVNEGTSVDIVKYATESRKKSENIFTKVMGVIRKGIDKLLNAFRSHNTIYEKNKKFIKVALANCAGQLNSFKMIKDQPPGLVMSPGDVYRTILGVTPEQMFANLDRCKDFEDFRKNVYTIVDILPKSYTMAFSKIRSIITGAAEVSLEKVVKEKLVVMEDIPMVDFIKKTNDIEGTFLKLTDTGGRVPTLDLVIENGALYNNYKEAYDINDTIVNYCIDMYNYYNPKARNPQDVQACLIALLNRVEWVFNSYANMIVDLADFVFAIASERAVYLKEYMSHVITVGKDCYATAGGV